MFLRSLRLALAATVSIATLGVVAATAQDPAPPATNSPQVDTAKDQDPAAPEKAGDPAKADEPGKAVPTEPAAGNAPARAALPGPAPIPDVQLVPPLPTIPVRRSATAPNVVEVDPSILPKDREGIWILDFAFKPVRLVTVELPGKGRRPIYYMWYRVINRTGKPRMFVPQFTLVTDTGKRYEDMVLPQAVKVIQNREDPTTPLLGAVQVMGMIPPTGNKQGVDDAVYGVAVWEAIDPHADAFRVYVRGLSDGYQILTPPGGSEPVTRYKTLRIDFNRPGDDRNINEREIRLGEPPYEWIYW